MAKILNTDDLIEAAGEDHILGYDELLQDIVDAVDNLAKAMANYHDIVAGETTWEGQDFGGLCASFYAKTDNQLCPDSIDAGDPGGDWETKQESA